MVLTWTSGDAAGNVNGMQSAYSDDGGETWSKPAFISKQPGYGTQPLFFPDGSLAVLFENGSYVIQMINSPDGGQTYGTNRLLVTKFAEYHEPRARNRDWLISATTDRQAGIIFVTYQTLDGKGTNAHP